MSHSVTYVQINFNLINMCGRMM